MRELKTSDVFALCRLVNAIGIKDDLKKIALEANSLSEAARAGAGFDLMYAVFEKATGTEGEQEIYKFLANLFECSADEVMQMNPVDCIDKVLQVADVEKWKAFFSSAVRLIR